MRKNAASLVIAGSEEKNLRTFLAELIQAFARRRSRENDNPEC
jgi:hypothetical protein